MSVVEPAVERCLVLLKPECVDTHACVELVLEHLQRSAVIAERRTVRATAAQVWTHYADYVERFGDQSRSWLATHYEGCEVIALVLVGPPGLRSQVRRLIGAGDPTAAAPGTLRALLRDDDFDTALAEGRICRNHIHASDTAAAAEVEIGIWFGDET